MSNVKLKVNLGIYIKHTVFTVFVHTRTFPQGELLRIFGVILYKNQFNQHLHVYLSKVYLERL